MLSFTKTYLLGVGMCCSGSLLQAQNTTSPYSVYGIGDIEHRPYNRTSGMAGTGLALKSSWFVVDNNPASLTGLERSFYVVSLAMAARTVTYSGDVITADNRSSQDFGIKRFSLATKLNNFWASSVGFKQFSRVNYSYAGGQNVEGTSDQYTITYEGDGGLNDFYWTNAFAIGKKFSAALKLSAISGSVNQSQVISVNSGIETKEQNYYSRMRFEYGLLYSTPIGKKWNFSIGGRMNTKTVLSSERTLTVKEGTATVITDKPLESLDFSLPATYGIGIAIAKNNRVTVAADYTFENWSALNVKGSGWNMMNSHRLSGGIQFSDLVSVFNRPVEKKFFQLGAFINNSSLNIHNHQIREYGVTGGLGGVYRSMLYNLALEAGSRGTIQSGLIRENYVQLTIGISYRDFLFSKGRKYD